MSQYQTISSSHCDSVEKGLKAAAEKPAAAFRTLVYICSPYSGDIENNTVRAQRYCRFVSMVGFLPIAPHLLFPQFLDDSIPEERIIGLHCGLALLDKCSEVWVFGDHISSGMAAEIDRAMRRNLIIRYFNTNCEEVPAHA